MEKFPSDSVLKNLENELTHGVELAKQLQLLMNAESCSQETRVYLLDQILNIYDRVMSVIDCGGVSGGAMVAVMSGSPGPTLTGSPLVNYSDQEDQTRSIRWTQKVVLGGETGNETQLGDGYSWRKYGQKDILRSKYPRGYYRCTSGKGCLARKQVQRLDEDPTAFEVTYKGLHTCRSNPTIPTSHPQNEPKTPSTSHESFINQSQQEPFLNIRTSLKIIDTSNDIPSFSNFNPESDPIFPDDHLLYEDYLLDFMHPTAPELNYFNDYEALINSSHDIEFASKPPTQDEDPSLVSSSGQLGPNFEFGNSSYFP